MKAIIKIKSESGPRWNEFVNRHPRGGICHLWEWKEVLENSFGHVKGTVLAIEDDESGNLTAGMPIYRVKSRLTGNRLVSVPFATLSSPMISSAADWERLFPYLLDEYNKTSAAHMEIRSVFKSAVPKNMGLGVLCRYRHDYICLDDTPEDIKKRFSRSVRRTLLKALNQNFKLRTAADMTGVREFYRLYLMTRKRLGLPPMPRAFFENLWKAFSPSGKIIILFAEHKNKPVAGIMLFCFKNVLSLELSGEDPAYRHVSPTVLLYWQSIKLAYQEGCKKVSFGRTAKDNRGLLDFKSRWGTEKEDLQEFYYPKAACEKIGEKRSAWKRNVFRQAARIAPDLIFQRIGDFCYRHMG